MSDLELTVEDVGGIDRLTFRTGTGVTLVAGPNATNKSSLLRAVLFGVGADDVTVRTNADRARVELEIDGDRVERVAERTRHGLSIEGAGHVTDDRETLLLERFAGLTATNALRRAIDRGDDVENLLTEPLDVETLERERHEKLDRKRELERTIGELEGTTDEIERVRDERERAIERRDELDEEIERLAATQRSTDDELESLREERADRIAERDRLRERVRELEGSVDRLDERVDERAEELTEAEAAVETEDLDELTRERERLEAELETIDERLEVLQSVLSTNREMLESGARGSLGYEASLSGDALTCWTCGSDVPVETIEETTDEVADLVEAEKERRREFTPELDAVTDAIDDAERARRRVERCREELADAERTRDERRSSLESQRERLETVRNRVDELDAEIADREAETDAEADGELERARIERETARHEIDRLEDRITDLEGDQDRLEEAREAIETLSSEIATLTERIESRERELREAFNDAMDDLLGALSFERVERVWLDGDFDVVIARTVDGAVREDRLEHLAESEREMIGLVLGLAGYLAYDVAEISPVVTLDSLGAFDADRTASLVEYFADRTPYLLAAVHPEQATELPYEQVSLEAERVSD
ncbi:archaea-specific SMC-related protein [Halovivax gelatinilyticus]|uniref:archaea-specific SMC-related protein n=1 Tax=Halovivax gelatinilyticus TaxID=2961597 RepID=UPI0020CA6B78|nr:archaea-specific SMC-related protein [Halovivax gelatinilyticus]